jgi:hypothetical protein
MRRFKPKTFLFMFCVAILATAGQAAHAGLMTTFTATTSTDTSGMSTYDYTLTNEVGSDLPVVDLILNVDPTANLQNITGPTGWTIYYSAEDPVVEVVISFVSDRPTARIDGVFLVSKHASTRSAVLPDHGTVRLAAICGYKLRLYRQPNRDFCSSTPITLNDVVERRRTSTYGLTNAMKPGG